VNVRRFLLIFTVSFVSACSTPSKDPDLTELPVAATVVWGNQGYGGAAERVPGYVHALHRGGVIYRDDPESPEARALKAAFTAPSAPLPSAPQVSEERALAPSPHGELLTPQTVAAITAVTAPDVKIEPFKVAGATATIDDKRRHAWERYCDGARGMTDEEWQLIREAGAPENVPADLAGHCIHPK
jgi:hypothetical protein